MHDWIVNQMRTERHRLASDNSLIFQMREIGEHEVDAADDKLAKATEPMEIIEQWEEGLFDAFLVHSGKTNVYEVKRLGLFYACSCRDFEFSKTGCKHIALVFPKICRKCFSTPVTVKGTICEECKRKAANEAMEIAPYLPPTSNYRPTKIGSVRI